MTQLILSFQKRNAIRIPRSFSFCQIQFVESIEYWRIVQTAAYHETEMNCEFLEASHDELDRLDFTVPDRLEYSEKNSASSGEIEGVISRINRIITEYEDRRQSLV